MSVYIERDMKVYLSFKRKTVLFTKGIPKPLSLQVSVGSKQMSSRTLATRVSLQSAGCTTT
jgi:hypothetical protein